LYTSPPPVKRLILNLDGIGYDIFKQMQDGGYFRNFKRPSPMLATFPSISDPNWARLFKVPVEKGYTKAYFDPQLKTKDGKGKIIGGLIHHLSHMPEYEKIFHLKPEGFFQNSMSILFMETSTMYWMDTIEKELFEIRDTESYLAFIMNTDLIAHTQGKKSDT